MTWTGVVAAEALGAVFSFAGALVLACIAARVVRAPRWAPYLLCLPPAKVLIDLLKGPARDAYILSAQTGTRWHAGVVQVGCGFDRYAPFATLGGAMSVFVGGRRYALSAGSAVVHQLDWHAGAWAVPALLVALTAVAAARVARRVFAWRTFSRAEAVAFDNASLLGEVALRFRTVRLLVTRDFEGSPFTAGVWRPRIWLPESLLAELDKTELHAVLEHELAHARRCDVIVYVVLGVFGDLFWYVPGAGWLERRTHAALERAADQSALERGIAPLVLARAVVRTMSAFRTPVPYLARRGTGTRARLRALLELGTRRPRGGLLWLSCGAALALSYLALVTCFFGYM